MLPTVFFVFSSFSIYTLFSLQQSGSCFPHKQNRNRHIMSTKLWLGCSILAVQALLSEHDLWVRSGNSSISHNKATAAHTHTYHWMTVGPWDAEVQVCLSLCSGADLGYDLAGRHDTFVSPLIQQDWCTSQQYWNTRLCWHFKAPNFRVFLCTLSILQSSIWFHYFVKIRWLKRLFLIIPPF